MSDVFAKDFTFRSDTYGRYLARTLESPPMIPIVTAFLLAGLPAQDAPPLYERAATAFAVVMTGETAQYGNIILKKGITPAS